MASFLLGVAAGGLAVLVILTDRAFKASRRRRRTSRRRMAEPITLYKGWQG